MAPIESLAAVVLGDQKDDVGAIDRDLVGDVTLGLDDPTKVTGAHRVLAGIGDGSDTNNDTGAAVA
jgi:hypothetical protein